MKKQREEKRDFMDLTWLNSQYYELGRSVQDIADDQGVSMITIRKWVDKIEKPISDKKDKKEEKIVKFFNKSIKTCPHCGQKLNLRASFCIRCGEKVEDNQVLPSTSDKKEETLVSNSPQMKFAQKQLIPSISDTKEEKTVVKIPLIKNEQVPTRKKTNLKKQRFCPNCNAIIGRYSEICKQCEFILIKRCPLCGDYFSHDKQHICKETKGTKIKEVKDERQVTEESLTGTEEKRPVQPILEAIEKKSKVIQRFCKFCELKLNKKATFCPQCGTRVKQSKLF